MHTSADKVKRAVRAVTPPVLYNTARSAWRVGKRNEWVYEPAGRVAPNVKGWDVGEMRMTHTRAWPNWLAAVSGSGPLGVDFCRAMREDDGGVFATVPHRDLVWAHNNVFSYGYVLALTARGRSGLSVLDWGGGAGQYYPVSSALLPGVTFDYHVRDLSQVCEIGRELCPDVTFHTADDTIEGSFDLAYSASSLQFIEDWKHVVQTMARVSHDRVFTMRIPIVASVPTFVVRQRGYGYGFETEFLGWYFNRDEFLNHATSCGLELEREFVTSDHTPTLNAPEQASYGGFLFRVS